MCFPPGGDCVFDYQANLPLNSPGLGWVTEPEARSLGSSIAPLFYTLNLKLKDPAAAPAFASREDCGTCTNLPPGEPTLTPWQAIRRTDGQLVLDEQQVLSPGALLAGLLAIASVAVLAGGRMAEQTRRIGLLKAVGGTPWLVTVVLLAENLALAVAAAAAGLAVGWLAAPAITSPGAGLVGTPGAPSLTPHIVGEVLAVALAVALAATLVPAIRAARTSTVSALASAARRPRRRGTLIRISRRMPGPLLLGLRLVARRPRRAVLSAASVAVTATGVVATLAFHTAVHSRAARISGHFGNPVVQRDEQMLLVITVVLVALTVLNAICAGWATVLDARHASALARALGATPQQVTAGIATAQMLPAVPGALLGVPLGIGLFAVASHGVGVVIPPAGWLAAAVVGTVAAVGVLSAIPARIGARRPVAGVLAAESA
jgi:putative ABC transport system permease protein